MVDEVQKKKINYTPIRYTLIFSFLILIVPGFIIISVLDYFDTQSELTKNHNQMITQTDSNILNAIKLVNIGYNVLEQSLEEKVKNAYDPIWKIYQEAGGDPFQMDIVKIKKALGDNIDLYMIDADGVIQYTTFPKDLGLDFKQWPDLYKKLSKIRIEGQYVGDKVSVESRTGQLRKYAYWGTPDQKYIMELGLKSNEFAHLLEELDLVRIAKKLEEFNPDLISVRLFNRDAHLLGNPDYKPTEAQKDIITNVFDTKTSYDEINSEAQTKTHYFLTDLRDGQEVSDVSKVVELIYSTKGVEDYLVEKTNFHLMVTLIAILISIAATFLIALWITTPIKKMVESVDIIAGGDLEYPIEVTPKNELKVLKMSVVSMVENIRRQMGYISQLNKVYNFFVPQHFIKLLKKESILDIQLGDHVEKEMSILFADIRSFTTLSESMAPEENFRFLNSYLKHMEPVVTEHDGFIDKYIGDSIMALFPTSPDNALHAAVAMLHQLNLYNQERTRAAYQTIRIGIGLHTGSTILGTIGGPGRMEGTVISDAVNLASRIEGMTKLYGASLLISQHTYDKLTDPSEFIMRPLDRVKAKGKNQVVNIIEVFDGKPQDVLELKQNTLVDFQQGLDCYYEQEFEEAEKRFQNCFKQDPQDKAAQIYIARCHELKNKSIPEDWEGVTIIPGK